MTNWRDDKIYDYLIFTSICTSIQPHHTAILGPVEYPLKGLKKTIIPQSQRISARDRCANQRFTKSI